MAPLDQDLRYALRVLRKSPGFTAAAVLLLALGIGANSAIFSVVDAVLLRPLPFPDAASLVKVAHVPPARSFPGMTMFSVSPANYLDWRRQSRSFDSMAPYAPASFTLTGVDQPGRGNVVVLSHSFWKTRFAADPRLVGRKLTLDGQGYTVVGVLAPAFELAGWNPTDAQLWTPLAWNDKLRARRGIHDYNVVARLKPGVTARQAQAEMDTISSRLARQYPADDAGWGAVVLPLHGDVKQRGLEVTEPVATLYQPAAQAPAAWLSLAVRTVPPPLGSVAAIERAVHEIDPDQPVQEVATMDDLLARSLAQRRFNILLLAAFAGLALLLAAAGIYSVLAYSVRRRVREIGIRMALGAQLHDVLRLILVEGMKPALAGMALGLAAGAALDRVVASLLYGVSATDPATFAAVSILLGGVALVACVVPAWRATRVQPMAPLREE